MTTWVLDVFLSFVCNRPISQIPRYTCPISHDAPFRTEMCTFMFWMVHSRIWAGVLCGLWMLSIILVLPDCCQFRDSRWMCKNAGEIWYFIFNHIHQSTIFETLTYVANEILFCWQGFTLYPHLSTYLCQQPTRSTYSTKFVWKSHCLMAIDVKCWHLVS